MKLRLRTCRWCDSLMFTLQKGADWRCPHCDRPCSKNTSGAQITPAGGLRQVPHVFGNCDLCDTAVRRGIDDGKGLVGAST